MGKRSSLLLLGAGVSFSGSLTFWIGAGTTPDDSRWTLPFLWSGLACLLVGVLCLVSYRRDDRDEAEVVNRTDVFNALGRFLAQGVGLKDWLHRQADRHAHPTSMDARMLLEIANEKMRAAGWAGGRNV